MDEQINQTKAEEGVHYEDIVTGGKMRNVKETKCYGENMISPSKMMGFQFQLLSRAKGF